jgi:hypothetical protein
LSRFAPEEVRITIFFALVALRGAVSSTAGAGPSEKLNPARPKVRPPLVPPNNPPQYWTKWVEFRGVKVYQRDDLIDPLRRDPRGRTNLERMIHGLAPIGRDDKKIILH